MVSAENLLTDIKLSSVVSAAATGDAITHKFSGMDLTMKLHYLRGVYYFNYKAVEGLNIFSLKAPFFKCLELYYAVTGRIRRSDGSGMPFIKCNDSGVRIVEAKCNKSLDEWLEMNGSTYLHKQLVCDKVLGPDLAFSPLVFVQFTWFKCGGLSVGLSWSHVLGDAVAASKFINTWGHLMAANPPPPQFLRPSKSVNPSLDATKSLSVKQVKPVGDHWLTVNNYKLDTFTVYIAGIQLEHLQSKIHSKGQTSQIPPFQALSALIWRCLAKIRGEGEPKMVTICRNGVSGKGDEILSNGQIISTVKVDTSVAKIELSELAMLIQEGLADEKNAIEEMVEKDNGSSDFIIYGANLTFVNLEEARFYDLELNGKKPIFVNYSIDGVGDEGVVIVLRGPENVGNGRTINLTLPENEVSQLRDELKREWGIGYKND